MTQGYEYPVEVEGNYETEPSDRQVRILLRALWHYANAYEPRGIRDLTVGAMIEDLLQSGTPEAYEMTRDEWVEIGRATGCPV